MVPKPRSFIHLSDLHFGRHDPRALRALYSFLETNRSEIERLLITGDFTQRARSKQFTQAAQFLESTRLPVVAIPGNHDVPLFNLWKRLRTPYKRYELHLNDFVDHEFEDAGLIVLGVRTTNVWTVKNSLFTVKQADRLRHRFEAASGKLKLLLLHHPISDASESEKAFLNTILSAGVDVVLSGHAHQSSAVELQVERKKVLLCAAGTAISDRLREENNSFNKLSFHRNEVSFEVFTLSSKTHQFERTQQESFQL